MQRTLFLYLLLVNFSTCLSESSPPLRHLLTFTDPSGSNHPMQRVVIHNRTGDVYVSARNTIYQFDRHFKLMGKISTGPELDHQDCPPGTLPCDFKRKETDNDNKVLDIYSESLLLSCGTVFQGMCQVRSLEHLNADYKWVGRFNDTKSYVAGRGTTVAFFDEGPLFSANLLSLYSASMYDGRPLQYNSPSVSSRILVKTKADNDTDQPTYQFEYSHISDSALTAVKFVQDLNVKRPIKVDYIYGFSYHGFSYFVTTQTTGMESLVLETRLARVCQQDLTFFSYMEVPLRCQRGLDVYNLATSAYKGVAGPEIIRRLQLSVDVLYVSFATTLPDQDRILDRTKGTIVCSFPLNQVHESFVNATKDCFNAEPRTHLLKHILGFDARCTKHDESRIDYCGTGFNNYIEGREAISGGFRTHVAGVITSLAVTLQLSKTIAVMGTDEGDVIKVMLEKRDGLPLYSINIADEDESESKAIQSSNAFDQSHENIYFLTGNKLVKFPIGSCSVYRDCHTCLSTEDALKCGWCGGYCAHFNECETPDLFSQGICTPLIESVEPLRGPTRGGTLITLKGDNFGWANSGASYVEDPAHTAQIHVNIGGSSCEIILWQNDKVQCKTSGVANELSAPIVVDVKDNTWTLGLFDIMGNATSQMNFTYLVPKLLSANPKYGPFAGGTNVALLGENMDIGSSIQITVAGIPCTVQKVYRNVSYCVTGPSPSSKSFDSFHTGPYEMTIDNAVIEIENSDTMSNIFKYLPDPTITKIEPQTTTVSGSTNLTITGKHLDSIAEPKMVVLFTALLSMEKYEIKQNCIVINERTMKCSTPKIADLSLHMPTDKAPVIAHVYFDMDGVDDLKNLPKIDRSLSQLLYYPDPVYDKFENQIVEVNDQDMILEIKGKNVGLAHTRSDIRILVNGTRNCNVTKISKDSIHCSVPTEMFHSQNLGKAYTVEVYVGSLHFWLGKMKTMSAKTSLPTYLTVSLTILIVSALIFALYMIMFKLRCKKFFKKKHGLPEFSVSYNVSRDNDYSGTARQSNDYQDMRGRNMATDRPCSASSVSCQRTNDNYSSDDDDILESTVDSEWISLLKSGNILINRNHLALGEVIGQGHFGCVYKGELLQSDEPEVLEVAVKTLQNSSYRTPEDVDAFMKEGLMMKDLTHDNVLSLIGVCIDPGGQPIVIIPYMRHGDLLSYIRDETKRPIVKDLLIFGVEIACGMNYISEKKFVHRDLAARNCMLDRDMHVKVADFGLSRDVYEMDYYSSDNKTKLPVKWMAPESLEKGTYTTKSDVWSYGIVLWELLTRGVTPYPDVGNWDILNYLKCDRRMLQPSYCPDLVYEIMLECWSYDPTGRPTFIELEARMENIITTLEIQNQTKLVGLDVTYVNYPRTLNISSMNS